MDSSGNVQAEQTRKASALSLYINSVDRLWLYWWQSYGLIVWFTKKQNFFSPDHPFSWRNRVSYVLLLESKSRSMAKLIFVSGQSWWSLVCGTMGCLFHLQNISYYVVMRKETGWICPGIHTLLKKHKNNKKISLYLHTCANIYRRISVEKDQMVLKDI